MENLERFIRERRELEDWCSEIKAVECEKGSCQQCQLQQESNKMSSGLSIMEACFLVEQPLWIVWMEAMLQRVLNEWKLKTDFLRN